MVSEHTGVRRDALVSLAVIALATGLLVSACRGAVDPERPGATSVPPDLAATDLPVAPSEPGPLQGAALATVSGWVRDEAGGPVAGAQVRVRDQVQGKDTFSTSDAAGAFSLQVPATPRLWVVASHWDFGVQWSDPVAWSRFQRFGPTPGQPVDLVLRRGVVVRGRVLDRAGRPFTHEALFLVPGYVGSGPPRIESTTDADGRFVFERMVLGSLELVPQNLDQWRPSKPGDYLRVVQTPDIWLDAARAGGFIEAHLEAYTLVAVSIDVKALAAASVQVWRRWGERSSQGMALEVPATGSVEILMERGVEYELWVAPGTGRGMVAPWTQGITPQWRGAVDGPRQLTISAPSTGRSTE